MNLSNDDLRRFRSFASELPDALGDQVRAAIDAETRARTSSHCVACPECDGTDADCTLCGGTGEVDREIAEMERAA